MFAAMAVSAMLQRALVAQGSRPQPTD